MSEYGKGLLDVHRKVGQSEPSPNTTQCTEGSLCWAIISEINCIILATVAKYNFSNAIVVDTVTGKTYKVPVECLCFSPNKPELP